MKKLLSLLIILIPFYSNAALVSKRFFVTTEYMDFDKTIRAGQCAGTIPYPRLSHDDEEIFMRINEEIHDFVEIYAICNKGKRDRFAVSYDMPEPKTKEFFSVRWLTRQSEKLWRIDSLNFNYETGVLLKPNRIFNMLSNQMMGKMIELSKGHLTKDDDWESFLEKIEQKDIQLYLKHNEWYIVFNSTPSLNKIINVKIPKYFLIGNRDHDRG